MKIKHIYCFSYFHLFSPSVRYRAKYPLELFKEKYSIDFSFVFPGYQPANILHFIRVYISALLFRKKDSVIIIERVYTNFIYSFALKILVLFQKKNTLYDLDDAEYFDHSPFTINYFLKKCQSCSAGSREVKKYAEQYNSDTFILTSPVLSHDITKVERNSIFTIGWIGDFGGSHRESMYTLLFPALKEVDFPVKLIILGVRQQKHTEEINAYFRGNKNITVSIPDDIDWQDELAVYQRIKEFDIGVCPLIDNEITRAKSAFKIKQYFSSGVPALASNIGENAQFLQHSFNGYLCQNIEDYKKMIFEFKNMSNEKYRQLSSNAKKTVYKFDIDSYCTSILKHYENIKPE